MPTTPEPRPPLVLHRCPTSGLSLVDYLAPGAEAVCVPPGPEICGAPIVPDQPPRDGHAWIFCPWCAISVGVCGAAALAELRLEAAAITGTAP